MRVGRAGVLGLGFLGGRGLRERQGAGPAVAGAARVTTSGVQARGISGCAALCFATLVSCNNFEASMS